MPNEFVISDTHFFHINILKFCRTQFSSPEEMNEVMVQNWNKTVGPEDTVYHCGDVAFGGGKSVVERLDQIMPRLMGKKTLILGNHDTKLKDRPYAKYFEDIRSYKEIEHYKVPMVLCHFPLHYSVGDNHMDDRTLNLHGHIHQHLTGHPNHVNVCVEHTNFAPVSLEDIADGKFRNAV